MRLVDDLALANLLRGSGVVGDSVVIGHGPHLVDVDFTILGPVVADHPESGPSTTDGLGEVVELGNEQTGVVGGGTLEADTVTAGLGSKRVKRRLAVDTDADRVTLGLDQTRGHCRILALVLDESIVGIPPVLPTATLYSGLVSIILSCDGLM